MTYEAAFEKWVFKETQEAGVLLDGERKAAAGAWNAAMRRAIEIVQGSAGAEDSIPRTLILIETELEGELISGAERKCVWYQDGEDSDTWLTDCGTAFTLNENTPLQNRLKFCCFCGKPIDEELYKHDDDV